MRYRTRTGKKLSDQNVIEDLSKGTKDVLSGSPSSVGNFFFGLFYYIVGVSAFVSRVLLRVRHGERTFGLLTIVSIFFAAWLVFNIPGLIEATREQFIFFKNSKSVLNNNLIAFFMIIPFLFLKAVEPEWVNRGKKFYDLFEGLPVDVQFFLSIITLISLYHLVEVYARNNDKVLVNSFYRGDSLLFNKLNGKSIFGFKITMTTIWMFFEPILIFIIAYSIWVIYENENIAKLLFTSGICLFIEEFRVYKENRKLKLDLIDGWLDAQYVNEVQKQFKNALKVETTKTTKENRVSIGGNKDDQTSYQGSDSPYRTRLY